MKKIIIAGASVGILGLALLPTPGTFAVTTVTDTVAVTINDNCAVTPDRTVNLNAINPGGTITGTGAITVTCNNNGGWNVKAVGSQSSGTTVNVMQGTNGEIPSGTSGDASYWCFSLAGTTGITVVTSYQSCSNIPTTATKVASGSAIYGATLTATYKFHAANDQAAGTYTGKVTYTIAKGTS